MQPAASHNNIDVTGTATHKIIDEPEAKERFFFSEYPEVVCTSMFRYKSRTFEVIHYREWHSQEVYRNDNADEQWSRSDSMKLLALHCEADCPNRLPGTAQLI